jgi:hypothetical protein
VNFFNKVPLSGVATKILAPVLEKCCSTTGSAGTLVVIPVPAFLSSVVWIRFLIRKDQKLYAEDPDP